MNVSMTGLVIGAAQFHMANLLARGDRGRPPLSITTGEPDYRALES